jgi:hypothetical protein
MQRRTLLKLGAGSAAILALAGGGLLATGVARPGLVASDGIARLSAGGVEVFRAVGRGVLDGSLPGDASAQKSALDGLVTRLDDLVAGLSPATQAEVSQLLGLLASAPGRRGLAGLSTPWSEASVDELQGALQDMRFSSLALRQQAYHALHDLTSSAYFSDPSTWALLGYVGPRTI